MTLTDRIAAKQCSRATNLQGQTAGLQTSLTTAEGALTAATEDLTGAHG